LKAYKYYKSTIVFFSLVLFKAQIFQEKKIKKIRQKKTSLLKIVEDEKKSVLQFLDVVN